MTRYIRIDKREARRVYDTGGVIVLSLDKPEHQLGETVEWSNITTCEKGEHGMSFDALASDSLAWKHRYPGSQGLVWYKPHEVRETEADLRARARMIIPDSIEGTDLITVEVGGYPGDVILTQENAEYLHHKLAMLLGLPCDGL